MAEAELERPDPTTERDAVNDAVREAITSLKGDEPEEIAAEAPEAPAAPELAAAAPPAAAKDARARDATGKFLPKEASKSTDVAPKQAAPEKLPAPEEPTKASVQPPTAGTPPVSWAADAKQAWAALPPAVQAAALKREEEVSRGFRQYSEQTKAYERIVAPVAQEAQRAGLNLEQGIQRLLDGHRFLETQPAQAILWLAQKHNLNLAEIAANPPAPQAERREPSIPPQFVQQVSSLEKQVYDMRLSQNQAAVEQFAQKNPHFDTIPEEQIVGLMSEIKAVNPSMEGVPLLQAAYDRAIWLNPDVRSKLIAEQHQQTQQVATQKIAEKSARAARAAVSLKGSTADTRPPPKSQQNGSGHVTDDVRAALEQLRAQ